MGRRLRVEYQGAMYHVIQRGNNREFIFAQPGYKQYLIGQMKHAVEVDGVEIFAYVVMSNHYHIALRTNKEPLSKVMHRLNTRFSRYYNRQQERTGHVFESRYKAVPIENERYLLAVVRYIHRNPVRAKLCSSVSEYKWSSDRAYRHQEDWFVQTGLLMDLLGNDRQSALKEYMLLMEKDDGANLENVSYIGQDTFALCVEPRQAVRQKRRLDEILIATGVSITEFKQIKSGSRKRTLVPFKAAYAREALQEGYTLQEIGDNIGISAPAVYKLANE